MKTTEAIGMALRIITLTLLLDAISLQWNGFLQYLFAFVAVLTWGASGYLEGLADRKEE